MTWRCPNCDYPNPDNRQDCFKCHSVKAERMQESTPLSQQQADQPTSRWVTERAKSDISDGLLHGWGACGCAFWIGLALCSTGIGAFVGVPVIIGGLLALIIAPFAFIRAGKKRFLLASCPFCGLELKLNEAQAQRGWVDCCGCKKRLLVLGNELTKPNPPKEQENPN